MGPGSLPGPCTDPCGTLVLPVPGAMPEGRAGQRGAPGPGEGAGRISCAAAHPALPLPQMPSFVLSPSQGRCSSASLPAGERGGAGLGRTGIPAFTGDIEADPCLAAAWYCCLWFEQHHRQAWMDRRMDGWLLLRPCWCNHGLAVAGHREGVEKCSHCQASPAMEVTPLDLPITNHLHGS